MISILCEIKFTSNLGQCQSYLWNNVEQLQQILASRDKTEKNRCNRLFATYFCCSFLYLLPIRLSIHRVSLICFSFSN